MNIKPPYCIDEHGYWAANADIVPPMICSAFEDDLQGSIRGCLDLMTAIERVSVNPDIQHADTGNAHSILISKDGVTITNLWHQHRREKEARPQSLEG
jgi:hypothetical protein